MNLESLSQIAVKRGYFWQSAENYGKISGFYDYGPLGVRLRQKMIECWRKMYVHDENFLEIETPSITPFEVFHASGHINHFTDAVATCKKCKKSFRADKLIEETIHKNVDGLDCETLDSIILKNNIVCLECNSHLEKVKSLNLMFETHIGPVSGKKGFLRPETAQGIFIIFNRLYRLAGSKLPFGVVQIGKGFRNEISPRQGMIRLREFTMMEAELFLDPDEKTYPKIKTVENVEINVYLAKDQQNGTDTITKIKIKELIKNNYVPNEIFAYYLLKTNEFLTKIGIPQKDIRFRQQHSEERAHYSTETYDAEVRSDVYGWVEVAGHAYRSNYDLRRHSKYSKADMYAYVKYDAPKKVKETLIKPNRAIIGKTFKKDSKRIISEIESMPIDEIIQKVRRDELVIFNHNISKDMIEISEVESMQDGKKIIPSVYEPSYGLDRCFYFVLEKAFTEEEGRCYFKIAKKMAPISLAVFPIVSKDLFITTARGIYDTLKSRGYSVILEDKDSIGKRYAKADEIGVPYCVTVDNDTLKDTTITIRDRDSKKQVRVLIDELPSIFQKLYENDASFEEVGTLF